jgi:hypothetical protein
MLFPHPAGKGWRYCLGVFQKAPKSEKIRRTIAVKRQTVLDVGCQPISFGIEFVVK